MRKGNLLFSAVQFLFVIALFLLGGLFLGLQHAPHLRVALASLILDHAVNLKMLGYVMFAISGLLSIGFYVMYRGTYFKVCMDVGTAIIEPKLIEGLIQDYWHHKFPQKELKTEVILRNQNQIEVIAEVPESELKLKELLLADVEKELGHLLASHLDYRQHLMMTLKVI